jgi:kinesin family protein 18/19
MSSSNVIVAVRIRPPNNFESNHPAHREVVKPLSSNLLVFDPKDSEDLWAEDESAASRSLLPSARHRDFHCCFDCVFGPNSTQEQVYLNTAKHVVDGVLKGYNASVFAYGPTGAGKEEYNSNWENHLQQISNFFIAV